MNRTYPLFPFQTPNKNARMKTEGMAKPTAKRESRASRARKPAAKATKTASAGTKAKGPAKPGAKAKPGARVVEPVKLLSGGNPQIAKADGDALSSDIQVTRRAACLPLPVSGRNKG
jgi:hypothetical protein